MTTNLNIPIDNTLVSNDIIFINELKIKTYIGIHAWEQKRKQPIMLNLQMHTNTKKAAATDNINDTIDYQKVYNKILSLVTTSKFQLIETLAEQIAKMLLDNFPITYVKLHLKKPKALKSCSVGLTIERNINT